MKTDTMDAPLALYSRTFGSGPRKAVALHCSLAHSGAWRGVASHLEDELTITALDLPGHGKSPVWGGYGDLTHETLKALLPLITEPVDLIGHSFGGVLSLLIALEKPEMVRSLSLFEPVLMAVAREDAPEEHQWNSRHMAEINGYIDAGDPAMGARLFLRVWGDGRPWDRLPEELQKTATRLIPFIGASQPALSDDNANLIPRLGQINVPCVLMDGGQSPALMKTVQDGLAARIPNARRVTFESAGHMGPITHAAEVAAEIRKTMAEAAS